MTPKFLIILFVVIFASLASGWENYNTIDFAVSAANNTECQNLNITEIVNVESVNPPSAELLRTYMASNVSRCEKFIRGTHHYFQLNDPHATCERFYPTIHEWWGLWNWRFFDCGVDFGKTDADRLINIYSTDFWTGELEIEDAVPVFGDSEYEWNITPSNITPSNDFFGGGGLNFTRDIIWETFIFMPNVFWVEITFMLMAYYIGGGFWRREEWSSVVGNMTRSPGRAVLMSWNKKFTYWFVILIIINIIFWFAFYSIK